MERKKENSSCGLYCCCGICKFIKNFGEDDLDASFIIGLSGGLVVAIVQVIGSFSNSFSFQFIAIGLLMALCFIFVNKYRKKKPISKKEKIDEITEMINQLSLKIDQLNSSQSVDTQAKSDGVPTEKAVEGEANTDEKLI